MRLLALTGLFITALVISNVVGGKLVALPWGGVVSAGILAFPIAFLVTDLINEGYGPKVARQVTWVGLAMNLVAAALLWLVSLTPTAPASPVGPETYATVFGLSGRLFLASVVAYVVGQLVDIAVFHRLRQRTQGRCFWLRVAGSNLVSQAVDTAIVVSLAFGGLLPGPVLLAVFTSNAVWKLAVIALSTPLAYPVRRWGLAATPPDDLLRPSAESAQHAVSGPAPLF